MSFEYMPRITQNDFYDFYNDTLVPAAEVTISAVQNGAEILYQGVKQAEGYWETFNNVQVRDWTEAKMSPKLAKIAQAFVHAIPVIVLFKMSLPVIYAGCALYTGCKIAQISRNDISLANTPNMFINAAGFLSTYEALLDLGTAAFTFDSSFIGIAIYEVVLAAILFDWSGLIQNVNNAQPQPQPQLPQEVREPEQVDEPVQENMQENMQVQEQVQEQPQEEQVQPLYPTHRDNTTYQPD